MIAHDFMETYGGAERVTQEIAQVFPGAPVYTLLGRPRVASRLGIEERFHSLLPARERILRRYRLGAGAFALWADTVRLPPADVLVTSSYGFAHRLRTENRAPQVCYCHSPLRFVWTMSESYRARWAPGPLRGAAFDLLVHAMRRSDRRAAARVDRYLAQSPYVADQIKTFYGRETTVIGAPVDCELFAPNGDRPSGDYYLFCGRLVEPYKRIRETIEAFRELGLRLVVAGDGPAMAGLRAGAPANVEFTGHLDDAELVPLMRSCRALIFPSRDDFGLLPLEAMACGRPVLAFAGGGASYTVAAGVTGEFFREQTPAAIAAAVRRFDPDSYDPRRIRAHALNWDRGHFRERLLAAVAEIAP